MQDKSLSNTVKVKLVDVFAKFLQIKPYQVNTQLGFFDLGLESAQLLEVLKEVEDSFATTLNPTLLFEYNNIDELVEYFSQENQVADNILQETNAEKFNMPLAPSANVSAQEKAAMTGCRGTDIAIISLSGRYPQADTMDEFWQVIKEGRDCITEVPQERWDYKLYYDEDKNKLGKTCSKWGSFIADVDKFDPLFFNVVPKYAEFMDPQERLFLECVWNLFETIGYTQETLQRLHQGKIGVYVGAMHQQYLLFQSDFATEAAMAMSSYGSIANRVSYFFNLQGPSVAIDTMCSSSATAIHMACESLIRGECQAAIAGGVNLSIHPKKYVGLSQAQLLGSRPDCRSFGDGDGYIAGEGVGAVLLKPLAKAIQDKDTILAVIKSTTANHSGRGNAFAVPNGNAQARLMEENLAKSGINPATISYVESAANGSALGDPIELSALTKVFQKHTSERQFCAIGSVKSNFGHNEAVSGLCQLTKVVLQLQHQQLVPSIKAEPLNPNIHLTGTPFHLQQELQEWKKPVLRLNGQEQEYPRRAMVNSFGAGGSNVHLIIEEYSSFSEEKPEDTFNAVPQIAVFSAKNRERLLAVVEQMLRFVERKKDLSLADFAYTLQVGREAMEARLALIVSNQTELLTGLQEFLVSAANGQQAASVPIFIWDNGKADSEIRSFLTGTLEETVVQMLVTERNLSKIALYWSQGGQIPWELLHNTDKVQRISLPTYPFARERYWVQNHAAAQTLPRVGLQSQAEISFTVNSQKPARENVEDYITHILVTQLQIPEEQINVHKNVYDYGIDSIILMNFITAFEQQFHIKLTLRELLEHPTIAALAVFLGQKIDSYDGCRNEADQDSKLETGRTAIESPVNEEVVNALEKLVRGELDLAQVREIVEGGQDDER